jgi:hypothetical protein
VTPGVLLQNRSVALASEDGISEMIFHELAVSGRKPGAGDGWD